MAELNRERSDKLFHDAERLMPGGVSSPVRSFRSVESHPFFVDHARGAELTDVDGNTYIDFVQSWGALLFGHAHPDIIGAANEAAAKGTSFGTPGELEVELARLVVELVPSIERVRFVSTGTEAGMTAIRLARAATGRSKVVKFAGCYHGHSDTLLADVSAGITPGTTADTLVANYNDLDSVERLLENDRGEVAAIIVEPVAANMGLVLPHDGFLAGLRQLATDHGALLIFDEVITGFRLGPGGAQERFGVTADVVMLGKILGGGFPVGAVAGPAAIMDQLAPDGPVYQAGTWSGTPVSMAAGVAALTLIRSDLAVYERIQTLARSLVRGLVDAADEARVPLVAAAIGGLGGIFFSDDEVNDFEGASKTHPELSARFFKGMLERGIYTAPSRFEALFISATHTEEHVDAVVEAAAGVFAEL